MQRFEYQIKSAFLVERLKDAFANLTRFTMKIILLALAHKSVSSSSFMLLCLISSNCHLGKMCGRNEEYSKFEPMCPKTCDPNQDSEARCTVALEKESCICSTGYVRRRDGRCVRESECNKLDDDTRDRDRDQDTGVKDTVVKNIVRRPIPFKGPII